MTPRRSRRTRALSITAELALSAIYLQRILNMKAQWKILPDGRIHLSLHAERSPDIPVPAALRPAHVPAARV